jgi:hypothetical protein
VTQELDEKVPSIGISYQVALHAQRQLVLQSFIGRDCSKDELNTLLDKLRNAGERQFAWGQIDDLQLKIEQEYKNARDHQIRIEKADAAIKAEWANGSRRGDVCLSQSQLQKQREAYDIAEGLKERIAVLTKNKMEWETKLAAL